MTRARVDITLTGEACANVLQAAAAVGMDPAAWMRAVIKAVALYAVVQDEVNKLEGRGLIVRVNPCVHCGKPHTDEVTPIEVLEVLEEAPS